MRRGDTKEYLYPRRPRGVDTREPPEPLLVRPRATRRTYRRTRVIDALQLQVSARSTGSPYQDATIPRRYL